MLSSIFISSLVLSSVVGAAQHAGRDPRRHHHRLAQRAAPSCKEGEWQCSGTELQQCVGTSWSTVRDCTGENMVCSATADNTGCIWSWDADASAPSSSASASASDSDAPTPSPSSAEPVSTGAPGWYTRPGDEWNSTSTTSSAGSEASAPSSTTDDWEASSSTTDAAESASTSASSPSPSEHASTKTSTSKSSSAPSPSASSSQSPDSPDSPDTPDSPDSPDSPDWKAPHHVIYSDYWLQSMPDPSLLVDFNRFILAFWMAERGAVDNAQMWEWMDAGDRQKVLDSYHAAGIALMVSAFGSTDSPVSSGIDPVECARRLSDWVKKYNLDGVDIDWEDMNAMNTGIGEAWIITFQSELRRQLPAGQYLISHAPVAPWFTSGSNYPNGAYVAVHKQTGSGIDFYNMQFYNQGHGVYEDCQSLIFNSGDDWPSTSVMEMQSYAGIPLDKIVIGKPINAGAADNGYMSPEALSECVRQAKEKGWTGGVMYWEWNSDTPRIMATTLS